MSTRKVLGENSERLKGKAAVIIGVGGLGCTVANLLARLGIKLMIIDHDIVDDTNLERQILFDKDDLLKKKVHAAKEKLSQFTEIIAIDEELTEKNIGNAIQKNIDLVIDCTDNVKTRLLVNRYCIQEGINWIYSAAVHSIGAIYFIDNKKYGACYECIQQDKEGETSCEIGVLNSLVVMVASLVVNMAVEYLSDGKTEDKLLRINMSNNSIMKISVKKAESCGCRRGK